MNINMTITALLKAYRNGESTPQQVIDEILSKCDEYETHNLWITRLSREQIQVYIDRIAARSIDELPLYGIPFAIKDNIDLAGVPTTAACPAYQYTAGQSAFVVERLINAGAIPIGKTNMDQFATGLVGTRSPEPWGACKNAFDTDYISGGSSSGSAVTVALGLVSFSLGTDTAGSGRVPAAFNNIIGVKPSRGLLSMTGVVPACRSLDCVSIFALSTDDANLVLAQAAGYDHNDQYSRPCPYDNNQRHYGMPAWSSAKSAKEKFVFGIPQPEQREFFGNESARHLYQQAIDQLIHLGGRALTIDYTPFIKAARLLYEGPWVAERYVAIEEQISQHPEQLLPVIREIISQGKNKTAVDAFKAEYEMQRYRKVAQETFGQIDFMVTPTAATIYTIDEVNADPIKLNSNLGYYTNYLNLLDCAAVAVPAGRLDNGLPWGISLIAPAMQDRKLLSFAKLWQENSAQHPGALDISITSTTAPTVEYHSHIPVVVCGAHLEGLPLNWQLTERGAKLLERTSTSAKYRMYALAGGPPFRPGLIRDETAGQEIEVEVWSVPKNEFGSFVEGIPAPLGIGKVELKNGTWLPGFICEGYGIADAQEITEFRSWRSYSSQ
jgi:allophanate hydrolase